MHKARWWQCSLQKSSWCSHSANEQVLYSDHLCDVQVRLKRRVCKKAHAAAPGYSAEELTSGI